MLQFYNTLSKRKEIFEPLEPGRVTLYSCGPTVYNFAHVGNLRAFLFVDLLKRYLEYRGFNVLHVMNITDVDDKIIRDSTAVGEDIETFTQRYEKAFFEDLAKLNIEKATHYPRATEHIPEMLDLIGQLEKQGRCYESEGSVYYRLATFDSYGRLSGLQADGLKAGARVDSDEYEKDDVRDFVLWKANKGEAARWDSPWGWGRPGWHIECSAMSMKYLGKTIDIHTGGEDLVFPHHENEIAQSEGASGKPFVRYWMHNRHLVVDGEKMSKSKGNFFTLRDLMEKGYDPIDIRYVYLTAHYRSVLDFSLKALDRAKATRRRLLEFKARMSELAGNELGDRGKLAFVEQCREKFEAALDDDLDMPKALAALFELVAEGNRAADAGELTAADAASALAFLHSADRVLGVLVEKEGILPEEIEALIEERIAARKNKDFKRADQIRDDLAEKGIVLKDTPQGTRWQWK